MTHIELSASGDRNVVPVEEAAEIAERFLAELSAAAAATAEDDNDNSKDDTLTLDLSCRAWEVESLQQLQPVFDAILSKVTTLKLDDIIASLSTEKGLATFQYLADTFAPAPRLTVFHFDDNAVGTRGIAVLRPLLSNTHIRCLTLHNCGLAEADAAILHQVLGSNGGGGQLQSLTLGRNQMGIGGAVHIGALLAELPHLEKFSYAGSRPLKAGSRALAQGLAEGATTNNNTSRLRYLDLNDCHFGSGADGDEDGVVPLCLCLRAAALTLEHLNLRDGMLGCEGLERVLAALSTNNGNANAATVSRLTHLELGAIGELGREGAELLCQFLRDNPATAAALEYLGVDANELGDDGVAALVEAAAVHCHTLQTLNLDCNEVAGEGARALVDRRFGNLQTLLLEDNLEVPAGAARRLKRMYPTVVVDGDLEEDDGEWSDGEEEENEGEEEEDAAVDELGDALGSVQI